MINKPTNWWSHTCCLLIFWAMALISYSCTNFLDPLLFVSLVFCFHAEVFMQQFWKKYFPTTLIKSFLGHFSLYWWDSCRDRKCAEDIWDARLNCGASGAPSPHIFKENQSSLCVCFGRQRFLFFPLSCDTYLGSDICAKPETFLCCQVGESCLGKQHHKCPDLLYSLKYILKIFKVQRFLSSIFYLNRTCRNTEILFLSSETQT